MFVNSEATHAMSEVTLKFSNVTYGFGELNLFEGLTCTLGNTSDAGKVIALMGPSGVGKTTFCDLALGVRRPKNGSISFAPQDSNVAVIPQRAVLFDELSVKENIACLRHSKTLGPTFDKKRVEGAVVSLGLEDVIQRNTSTNSISGGEAQRVMLARTQTINCNVLVLDEPCSFLDNRVKDSFLKALRSTVDKSRLLALMVTHVWSEARQVADEVIFFSQVPGKPVTLHCQSIIESQQCPPTIDALYGIHWPDCLVLDITETAVLADFPCGMIPHGACFIGFFQGASSTYESTHWLYDLWMSVRESSVLSGRASPFVASSIGDNLNMSSVFYDANGLLMKVSI